jgi:RNA polymerase sigma-70 factor (ECF subfamily)
MQIVNLGRGNSSIVTTGEERVESALTATLNPAVQAPAEAISASSFEDIMRRHQRRVHRVIYLLVRNEDIADNLTQECFLRAYQKRASFRGECRIETWLLRIALNLVRDQGKNRRASFWKRLIGVEEHDAAHPLRFASLEPSPERVLLAREELQSVWNALSSLSPQQREIFFLRFAEEMPLLEIAELLELKIGTVKAQLARATAKLREMKEKQWR